MTNEKLKAAADMKLPDVQADAAGPAPAPTPKGFPSVPVCPFCQADPQYLHSVGYQVAMKNGAIHHLHIAHCANPECRRTMGVYCVAITPPTTEPAPSGQRVA